MTSQGVVKMTNSVPKPAARSASKRAIVPYPVPEAMSMLRSLTARPTIIRQIKILAKSIGISRSTGFNRTLEVPSRRSEKSIAPLQVKLF
jgi:hypothetical protein